MGRKKTKPRADGSQDGSQLEVGALFDRVVAIMDAARDRVVRQVNHEMLIAYWHIGREIVEGLQEGEGRAAYGREVLKALSRLLTERYGRGFSFTNLSYFRLFYRAYATRRPEIEGMDMGESGADRTGALPLALGDRSREVAAGLNPCTDRPTSTDPNRHKSIVESQIYRDGPIHHSPSDELGTHDLTGPMLRDSDGSVGDLGPVANSTEPFVGFASRLSWTHYRILTKIEDRAARQFYEIEADAQGWSVRQLERQIDSLLFARLLKSRDKAGLLELSTQGQVIESPVDALKDPYVLDFLDLPDSPVLHESDLEEAILHKLRSFLLELGKGFAFVARQQRLSFEDEHFYVDLVFYNITLKCYLLVDLKVGKLTHQDIGQMDGYVRLFDDQCTADDDNPTIGLILCARRNEAIARYSVLSESEQIFAARYVQILPSVEELQRELEQQRRRLDQGRGR